MTKTTSTEQQEFRVLKTATCPSLSGKSKLTYEIACGPASDLHLRILKNSGGGYFSVHWVGWVQLQAVLDKNGKQPITHHTLSPLYKGLSVNTPGFLLAALKHEGLVQPHSEFARCYERTDPAPFFKEMKSLLAGSKAVGRAKPKVVVPKLVAVKTTAPKKP